MLFNKRGIRSIHTQFIFTDDPNGNPIGSDEACREAYEHFLSTINTKEPDGSGGAANVLSACYRLVTTSNASFKKDSNHASTTLSESKTKNRKDIKELIDEYFEEESEELRNKATETATNCLLNINLVTMHFEYLREDSYIRWIKNNQSGSLSRMLFLTHTKFKNDNKKKYFLALKYSFNELVEHVDYMPIADQGRLKLQLNGLREEFNNVHCIDTDDDAVIQLIDQDPVREKNNCTKETKLQLGEEIYSIQTELEENENVLEIDRTRAQLREISARLKIKKDKRNNRILLAVNNFIIDLFEDTEFKLYDVKESEEIDLIYKDKPFHHLFVWAVLVNSREMAMIFWELETDHTCAALFASAVLNELAEKALFSKHMHHSASLKENAGHFETLACNLMTELYSIDRESALKTLVTKVGRFNSTPLKIAVSQKLKKFMAHTACQAQLNIIWSGDIAVYTSAWKIAYMTFVIIFAIFVLTDLYPLAERPPSIFEYLTWVWTLSLAIEEIRQAQSLQNVQRILSYTQTEQWIDAQKKPVQYDNAGCVSNSDKYSISQYHYCDIFVRTFLKIDSTPTQQDIKDLRIEMQGMRESLIQEIRNLENRLSAVVLDSRQ
ncbi:unnamed protein product [Mytilus edulis]|uniref:TRPM-like domain-containing protein n=1 Tax=Mytilus edulis TaxID=6550 RepID=A0A8S3RUW8_MYTED|nr:unnamed protein product [Mytilus edulis]